MLLSLISSNPAASVVSNSNIRITDLTEVSNADTLWVETSHPGGRSPAVFTDDDTADCGSATTGQARWSSSTHSAASRWNGEPRKHRTQQRVFFRAVNIGATRKF